VDVFAREHHYIVDVGGVEMQQYLVDIGGTKDVAVCRVRLRRRPLAQQ
jgi:hypothetical protein